MIGFRTEAPDFPNSILLYVGLNNFHHRDSFTLFFLPFLAFHHYFKSQSFKAMEEEDKMDMKEVIKRHVLPFVPAKSLYKFKSVSKNWNKWITSPFFSHQQSNYFTKVSGFFFQTPLKKPTFISFDHSCYGIPRPSLNFLPGNITLRSSSNGLLCCRGGFLDDESNYFICNPVTGERAQLSQPILYHGSKTSIALVFQPSPLNFEAHFELICAVPLDFFVSFEIYSSRTNSWRVSETEYYYNEEDDFRFNGDGFFINSFVYWETSNGVVLAFDLKDEQYGELLLPVGDGETPSGVLSEMNGELCYIIPRKNENDEYVVEVYGDHNMELKSQILIDFGRFGERIDGFGEFKVLGCVNDDLLVIVMGMSLILYNVEEKEAEIVKERVGLTVAMAVAGGRYGRYLPYVNSLVSVCPVDKMPLEEIVE